MAASHSNSRTTRQPTATPVPAFFLYGEPLRPPDQCLVHVETIATRSRLHDWIIRPHRHRDLHQLLLIERGLLEARVGEATQSQRTPAIVLVPPGIVHAFRFQPGTVGLVISFASGLVLGLESAGSDLGEFLERPALTALDRTNRHATDLGSLANMLLREFLRSASGRELALRGLLAALLANVMRLARVPAALGSSSAARERALVGRFRRLIEAQYREHIDLAAYAADLCVSQSRLRRACISICGQSPSEVVHLRLLLEAERLLRYTRMSIAQVAYHLGFDDPAYFSRFFTRRMRVSPRQFRARDGASTANARA